MKKKTKKKGDAPVKKEETMKGKYLSPKADLTFKLVFAEHKDLMMSLLNALLPLPEDAPITSIEYETPEMIPERDGGKNSVVDVRCKDARGRRFLVEMQMNWDEEFKKRVVMNAAKAVMKQVGTGEIFKLIQPVFSLNLLNEKMQGEKPEEFYHDYAILNVDHPERSLDYLRFVFVELPKFKPRNIVEKKMAVLWLRFLTEINEDTIEAPAELLENAEISKALSLVEKSAMNESQLYAYERFWDEVNIRNVLKESNYKRGLSEGRAEGKAEGRAEGIADTAQKMKADGMTAELIAKYTGLTIEEVQEL